MMRRQSRHNPTAPPMTIPAMAPPLKLELELESCTPAGTSMPVDDDDEDDTNEGVAVGVVGEVTEADDEMTTTGVDVGVGVGVDVRAAEELTGRLEEEMAATVEVGDTVELDEGRDAVPVVEPEEAEVTTGADVDEDEEDGSLMVGVHTAEVRMEPV
jgi:hypothetical protein